MPFAWMASALRMKTPPDDGTANENCQLEVFAPGDTNVADWNTAAGDQDSEEACHQGPPGPYSSMPTCTPASGVAPDADPWMVTTPFGSCAPFAGALTEVVGCAPLAPAGANAYRKPSFDAM